MGVLLFRILIQNLLKANINTGPASLWVVHDLVLG
jgi:hypothetical protein